LTSEEGIKAKLLAIRETEAKAARIQEDAEKTRLQLVEDAGKQAKQILVTAQRELDKYHSFVEGKVEEEAEATAQELEAKGDVDVQTLLALAKTNRSQAVEELMKQLTGSEEGP
jgi:vacuolar-type H+-ATPase subunit H